MRKRSPNLSSSPLKVVYHTLYMQMLIGAFLGFAVPAIKPEATVIFGVTPRSGVVLLFLALNTYFYLRRYEKSLSKQRPSEPVLSKVS